MGINLLWRTALTLSVDEFSCLKSCSNAPGKGDAKNLIPTMRICEEKKWRSGNVNDALMTAHSYSLAVARGAKTKPFIYLPT